MRYARKRDDCERAIMLALREAGASVAQLDGSGIPDLVVQYRGTLYLLECKDSQRKDGKAHTRNDGPMSELTPAQVRFFTAWSQPLPRIVHSPEEALKAIGATV